MNRFTSRHIIDWLAIAETVFAALCLPLLVNDRTRPAGVVLAAVCLLAVLISAALFSLERRQCPLNLSGDRAPVILGAKKGYRSAPKGFTWDRTGRKPRLIRAVV